MEEREHTTVGDLIEMLHSYNSNIMVLVGDPLDDLTFPRVRQANVTPISMGGNWWREDPEGSEQFLALVIR